MKRRQGPQVKLSRCTVCGQVFDRPDMLVSFWEPYVGYRRAYRLCGECRWLFSHPMFDLMCHYSDQEAGA